MLECLGTTVHTVESMFPTVSFVKTEDVQALHANVSELQSFQTLLQVAPCTILGTFHSSQIARDLLHALSHMITHVLHLLNQS